MNIRWSLALGLFLAGSSIRAAGPTVTIDATSAAAKVSPLFYGLMTEEINHAYDGGLYAELVRNRAFLDDGVCLQRFHGAILYVLFQKYITCHRQIGF